MNENSLPNQPTQEKLSVRAEMAIIKDLGDIKNLRLEAVKDSPKSFDDNTTDILERTNEEWEEVICGPNEFVVLDKMGSETMGMLSATKDESMAFEDAGKKNNVWYIRWGYLKPEFRKKPAGFAIAGLEECLKEIRNRGGEAAVLMVKAENEHKKGIVKIGKKFGFEIVEGKLRPGSVYMRLNLLK